MLGNITQGLKMVVSVDGVQKSQGELKKMDSTIGGMAKSLLGVAAATAVAMKGIQLMNSAISGAREQEIVNRMIAQQLRATGNAAGIAADELARMASEMQSMSNMDDEGILRNLTLPLLTFKQITGDVFARTQQAALDLNAIIGDPNNPASLRSSAIQLGKALQDPIQGLSALRRVGISFSNSQIEVIKNMAETGRLAEAQNLILDELQSQFGGAAQAGVNSSIQLKNAWGDYLESMGRATLPMLDGINSALSNFFVIATGNMDAFANTTTEIQQEQFAAWNGFATAFAMNADAAVRITYAAVKLVTLGITDAINTAGFALQGFVSNVETIVNAIVNSGAGAILGGDIIGALNESFTGMGSELANAWKPAATQFNQAISGSMKNLSDVWDPIKNYERDYEKIRGLSQGLFNQQQALRGKLKSLTAPEDEPPATGAGASTAAIQDYYSEIMLLNRTAEQEVIDSHNEMRASLYEYLKASEKDQAVYNAKLKDGMAEITESETAKLKEITDARLKEQQAILDAASQFGIDIMAMDNTETESARAKYEAMRIEAAKHYELKALSATEYGKILDAINAKELGDMKAIESGKLATRVDALRQLAGFESDYMAMRFQQINEEVARLQEAGLTEVQIAAWVANEKMNIAKEAGLAHTDMAAELADEITSSMERIQGGIESSLGNALYDLVSSTKSAGDAIRDLWKGIADSVIREITRMIAKMAIMKIMQMVIGMPTGGTGGFSLLGGGGNPAAGAFDIPGNTIASYSPQAPSFIDNSNQTLATKIDKLISAIQNNPPQIYTQVIDGIQMHKAVERSRMIANAL